jgi:hypothetical protein
MSTPASRVEAVTPTVRAPSTVVVVESTVGIRETRAAALQIFGASVETGMIQRVWNRESWSLEAAVAADNKTLPREETVVGLKEGMPEDRRATRCTTRVEEWEAPRQREEGSARIAGALVMAGGWHQENLGKEEWARAPTPAVAVAAAAGTVVAVDVLPLAAEVRPI